MKHIKKQILTLLGLALVITFSSAFIANKKDDPEKKRKDARVKIIKMIDGEKTVIDTTISREGDLDLQGFLQEMNVNLDLDITEKDGHAIVKIITDDEDAEENIVLKLDELDLNIFDIGEGESEGQEITIHADVDVDDDDQKSITVRSSCSNKGITISDENIHIITHSDKHRKIQKKSSKIIDLNDEDVISVKKKDMGDGKEKIEIIRKKVSKHPHITKTNENNIAAYIDRFYCIKFCECAGKVGFNK